MIVSRAPMLLTFLGNSRYTSKVISTTIDKYSYTVVNHTPLVDKISARYSISEWVDNPKDLKNDRIRKALQSMGIISNIEVGTFATFPLEVGFKSRTSYTASLLIALMTYKLGLIIPDKLRELIIGVEDGVFSDNSIHIPHAVLNGGLSKYVFEKNKITEISPIFMDFKSKSQLESSIVVYHVSINYQKKEIKKHIKVDVNDIRHLDELIDIFSHSLESGDLSQIAYWLHKGWLMEKKIGFNVPNTIVDLAFEIGFSEGALGCKYIGDNSSGCLVFINPTNMDMMSKKIRKYFIKNNIDDFYQYSIKLTQSGTNILLNTES